MPVAANTMLDSLLARLLPLGAALTLAASAPARAQAIYVVDDSGGPGVDFTTLQEAVDVAGPLDRIEIRAGSYGATIVRGPMTIMGDSNTAPTAVALAQLDVRGSSMVPWLSGQSLVVADLQVNRLAIESTGTTILDGLEVEELFLLNVPDLRLQRSSVYQGAHADASVMQVTSCTLTGSRLAPCSPGIGDGPPALSVSNGSHVTVTDSTLLGGPGEDETCSSSWGLGGPAILTDESELRLVRSDLSGGCNGWICDCAGFSCGSLFPNGLASPLRGMGNSVTTSDVSFTPANLWPTNDVPGLPAMTLEGDGLPGTTVHFNALALGGSNARLWVGRRPALVPVAGLAVPRMHSFDRGLSLGIVPPGGVISLPFTVPPLHRGTLIFAQSSRTLPVGTTELSNPVTLVVR